MLINSIIYWTTKSKTKNKVTELKNIYLPFILEFRNFKYLRAGSMRLINAIINNIIFANSTYNINTD